MHRLMFFILLIYIVGGTHSLLEDYYWREYTGTIPEDAITAGEDINGKNIYIGQAYVKNEGLVVAQIYEEKREVYAPMKGVIKVENYIKILCGSQQRFYWLSANSSSLHLILLGKHAVIGGHEDGKGQINIGRISHQGEVKIGKVNSFDAESAFFYFNDKGTERLLKSYEILMFDKSKNFDVRGKFMPSSS